MLAGPAEGWVVREDASVVGKTSGRPVLQLEDLLTALRTTEAARQQPISVSIDPTPEGEVRLNRLLSQVRTAGRALIQQYGSGDARGLWTAAGEVHNGCPPIRGWPNLGCRRLSHEAFGHEFGGISGRRLAQLHGDDSRRRSAQGTQPRWWMACEYDAILHSEDMLAWKLTGSGIKAMTEDEMVDSTGARSGTGRTNKLAQRWADLFTEKFDELCGHNAAFGDLRNVMDLNIVATVISGHELGEVAGCDFGLLRGEGDSLPPPKWRTPKTISPECSFVRGQRGWTVSASGGVEINPWQVVSQQSKADASVKSVYHKAVADQSARWWWN